VSILLLSFTRDSTLIPIAGAAAVALTLRSRVSFALLGTAVAAALPVVLMFSVPTRELLAMMLNDAQPPPDPSWGFVADRYPGAIVDLVRADAGYVRDGAWFSALYFGVGLALLFLLGRAQRREPVTTFLWAGGVASIGYVLLVPIFSAFRLELACIPMAAFGLALGAERLAGVLQPRLEGFRIRLDPRARPMDVA
jgi:hypothetical protein